ncbi:MAG: fibronectin type III domain-containing protein, partial [Planctomycetaceae bacterium]|nr:fibronectin type III domain-containing protein [Planctomycetaceae bacterium]
MGSNMRSAPGLAFALACLATVAAAVTPAATVPPAALLVTGTVSTQDTAIQTRLTNLGYTVTMKTNTNVVAGDATGKAVIVITASATSNSAGTLFKPSTVGIVNWHPATMSALGMSSATATLATQTQVTIQAPTHAMAAGLTGNQSVVSSATINWYTVAAAATKVASTLNDATKPAIFCYDTGATMSSGTAAGRRAGMYMGTGGTLTAAGGNLFDAAVRWVASVPAAPAAPTATGTAGQVALTWTASTGATGYNVKRGTVSGGPYTTVGSPTAASYTDTTGLTNGTTYYYVVTAVNANGESLPSAQVSATPNIGAALLITGTVSAQDTAIQTRLSNLGFTVTMKTNTSAVIGDATGKAVVVITASATSNSAGTTFKPSTVPIVNWHPATMSALGMSSATATLATQTQV